MLTRRRATALVELEARRRIDDEVADLFVRDPSTGPTAAVLRRRSRRQS
jgi:hypothetical protein